MSFFVRINISKKYISCGFSIKKLYFKNRANPPFLVNELKKRSQSLNDEAG